MGKIRRSDSRPRIVIDARPLSHPQPGGFRSYVRSLVKGLAHLADDAEFLLYIDRPLSPETQAALPPGVTLRVLSPNRLLTDFLLFARQLRRDAPDLVHGTMNYLPHGIAAPTTLALHDALQLAPRLGFKGKIPPSLLRQNRMNRYFAVMTRASVGRTRRIVTPSLSATNDLIEALNLPAFRFAVVPIGISLERPKFDSPRSSHGIVAFVSGDLRKGSLEIIVALNQWSRDGGPPLCVTMIAANRRVAESVEAGFRELRVKKFCMVCRPSDAEVITLYQQSAALLWPSQYEGFGLPPLEAMFFGCPVVSSSAPAMPEVLGDIPYYFEADFFKRDREAILSQLRAALTDSPERTARIERGRNHAAMFTCERMARQTMIIWREALNAGENAA